MFFLRITIRPEMSGFDGSLLTHPPVIACEQMWKNLRKFFFLDPETPLHSQGMTGRWGYGIWMIWKVYTEGIVSLPYHFSHQRLGYLHSWCRGLYYSFIVSRLSRHEKNLVEEQHWFVFQCSILFGRCFGFKGILFGCMFPSQAASGLVVSVPFLVHRKLNP